MKNKITLFFEDIGNIITSVYFVIMIMGMVIVSGCFLSHILFYRSFPSDMGEWEKIIASWTFGIAWECTLLIAATNRQHLDNENFVKVFAICSGVLLLFFMDAFYYKTHIVKEINQNGIEVQVERINWIYMLSKYFAALLIGFVNYTYSELFYRKWTEHKNKSDYTKHEGEIIKLKKDNETLRKRIIEYRIELLQLQIKATRDKTKQESLKTQLDSILLQK
jgi:hypothetical protein